MVVNDSFAFLVVYKPVRPKCLFWKALTGAIKFTDENFKLVSKWPALAVCVGS